MDILMKYAIILNSLLRQKKKFEISEISTFWTYQRCKTFGKVSVYIIYVLHNIFIWKCVKTQNIASDSFNIKKKVPEKEENEVKCQKNLSKSFNFFG